jgi:NAD(P)-dependent dehydrogenase (short-subunit alcohol dehydrogenase family)
MNGRLDRKVAIVTGAGRGVGRAYAHALAAEGAKVVVNDFGGSVDGSVSGKSPADEVVREIEAAGGVSVANYDDVSDFAAAGNIIETAVKAFGGVDILVANAGIIRPNYLHEMRSEDWSAVLAVHTNGTFNCYRHAVPLMINKNSGTVITTGAGMMWGVFPGLAAYRAAKAAILVLTQNAACELEAYDINVNCIMPGSTESRMQKAYIDSLIDKSLVDKPLEPVLRSAASPASVPSLGVFLCTDEGRRISGYSFQLDGPNISVVTSYGEAATLEPTVEKWGHDDLAAKLPGFLDRAKGAVPSTFLDKL